MSRNMNFFSRQGVASAGFVCLAIALGGFAGCAGHGNYTQEGVNAAQERMAQLKSATEYDVAEQRYRAGDLDKALSSVDKSISIQDGLAKSHLLKGRILIEMGRLESALASLSRAIELDENTHEAYYYRGVVLERFRKHEQALEQYTAAWGKAPENAQYLIAAAETMIELDDLDGANALVMSAMDRFEHNAGLRQTLGHVALMQGRTGDAITNFSEACLLAPDDQSLAEDLARAQYDGAHYADAERTLSRLLADKALSERNDLLNMRARCLIEIDRPVEARQILTAWVGTDEGASDHEAWSSLAEVGLLLNDRFSVRQAAQRLIALQPGSGEGYLYMGMSQREEGRLTDAARSFAKAASLDETDARPAVMLSMTLAEMGRTEDAIESVDLALQRDPANREALILRGHLTGTSNIAEVYGDTSEVE